MLSVQYPKKSPAYHHNFSGRKWSKITTTLQVLFTIQYSDSHIQVSLHANEAEEAETSEGEAEIPPHNEGAKCVEMEMCM